jgi:hypothetical protein
MSFSKFQLPCFAIKLKAHEKGLTWDMNMTLDVQLEKFEYL